MTFVIRPCPGSWKDGGAALMSVKVDFKEKAVGMGLRIGSQKVLAG